MLDFGILFSAVLNGVTSGAVYALVAAMWLIPDQRIEKKVVEEHHQ